MKDMFDLELRHEKDLDGRRITLIGFTEDKKCKDCAFLYYEQYANKYYRCEKQPKKNWKVNTKACAYFKEGEK